ncbi:MAG TPA: pyridoxamine 5'-phosphate oxidase family protein [Vicinamibacterales bacterium]|nr:pyridoxamine 5'-phosphate oxidase family protein [Vicinamibacterales bacterium]
MSEPDVAFLRDFIRARRWAVAASASPAGAPQAALIGVAVTDQLELVFDTLSTSRKATNLLANARIAVVIGGWTDADPRTLQYEGVADFPSGQELERVRAVYFDAFPDGRDRLSWPAITHVRVTPTWLRLSDFTVDPPVISERHL